jgi:hypothetical protein
LKLPNVRLSMSILIGMLFLSFVSSSAVAAYGLCQNLMSGPFYVESEQNKTKFKEIRDLFNRFYAETDSWSAEVELGKLQKSLRENLDAVPSSYLWDLTLRDLPRDKDGKVVSQFRSLSAWPRTQVLAKELLALRGFTNPKQAARSALSAILKSKASKFRNYTVERSALLILEKIFYTTPEMLGPRELFELEFADDMIRPDCTNRVIAYSKAIPAYDAQKIVADIRQTLASNWKFETSDYSQDTIDAYTKFRFLLGNTTEIPLDMLAWFATKAPPPGGDGYYELASVPRIARGVLESHGYKNPETLLQESFKQLSTQSYNYETMTGNYAAYSDVATILFTKPDLFSRDQLIFLAKNKPVTYLVENPVNNSVPAYAQFLLRQQRGR